MNVDIVCAEGELSMAVNRLTAYADFLARTLEAYLQTLSDIQEKGIQDELVCAKLAALAQALEPCKTAIPAACDALAADVHSYIQGVEAADRFVFPAEITASMASLAQQFL